MLTADFVKNALPVRKQDGHKGDFGKVFCLCGSVGYTGAAMFASRAAVRTGSGLVFLGVPAETWGVVAVKCDEAMCFPMPSQNGRFSLDAFDGAWQRAMGCDAVLVGCGFGRDAESDALVRRLLALPKPMVLDADGINALSGHIDEMKSRPAPTVLTPHEGEFARLMPLRAGREASALTLAKETGAVVVLKGYHTVIAAPDGRMEVNPTGNNGMAKGGSGDVLSGMVASLLGQGVEAFAAACCAVYLHGLAGDLAAAEKTRQGMTPSDMVEYIPYAYKEILR